MKTLQINEQTALSLYQTGSKELKSILADTFGESFFNVKITDRVKCFDDACILTGEDAGDEKFSSGTPDEIAYKKLKVIARALNEGWVPDWKNSSQYKYYPWFKATAGSGLSYYDCVFTGADADVGSRLCFKSYELAEYAGKQFEALYNDFLQ